LALQLTGVVPRQGAISKPLPNKDTTNKLRQVEK
jgi:hypothetical protein